MTKSVSNIVTASTVVAVAATAINQAEALNDRQHNRLRTLQEGGEDASASLSMLTNVESINNLINEEEPKFQEKKKEMDIGILMSSVMSKNSEFADKVSQALDQMGSLDKQELVEKVDELVDLVKHLLPRGKSDKSKSGKGSKASSDDGTCTVDGETIGPFDPGTVNRYDDCCEDSDCFGNGPDVGETFCYASASKSGKSSKSVGKECVCDYPYEGEGQIGDCCYFDEDCASGYCNYESGVEGNNYTCELDPGPTATSTSRPARLASRDPRPRRGGDN